ncbi:MAG: ThuA domain-containing protein [Bryobacter sp.]|nr:ThuA domain-containing protein [Bryobacter sp.]
MQSTLAAAARPRVVYVCGDHEYSGEKTLPLFAAEMTKRYGHDAEVLTSQPDQNAETNLPGLEKLAAADLVVLYLRWRRLPLEQVRHLDEYLQAGKPVVALRTSSHPFNYPKGDPLENRNRMATAAFGAPPGWGADGHRHYGHQSTTRVTVAPGRHEILRGVNTPFVAPSWLYHVLPKYPPPVAKVALMGEAINPNRPAVVNPVAWTLTNTFGARAFYTSLGHPGDFALEPFQRLLANAIHWALGKRVPRRWAGPMEINVRYRGMVKS